MRNRDICLLMFIMMLGACNVAGAEVSYTSSETSSINNSEVEIKGNKDSLDKAVEFMNNKDYESAVAYLSAYINSKPKKYEGYKLRGDAYYELRRYKLAEQDYQTAIDIKASNDRFLTGTKVVGAMVLGADKNDQYQNPELGNIYGRLMYAQKALNNPAYETTYMKAFEYNSHIYLPQPNKLEISQINCPQKYGKVLTPQGVDEYIYGAIEDIEKKHYNEAIYKIQNIISTHPKYYLGYYLNGVALSGLEREKEAIIEFEKALKLNPNDFESLASIGQIYFYNAEKTFSVADAKKSIEYFNKALKFNPNCYLYYFYIGLNELQMGNNDLAISNFNKAIKFKSNDYNSLYYKLIAQYIKGDYPSVVEGATKLLYKHVSNYNSVLYLRALAYYKQGQNEYALADLEQIQRSVNDIYNADVRVTSEKEKTLENYIYYLKAQILKSQGFGAISDLMKAHQNPIVAKLSKVESSMDVYEKKLNEKVVTLDTYNSYSDFYNSSLPKMLKSDLLITVDDIDKQYDYIRTTFDNLGITFEYLNPYYKMTTIKDYVYKKYSSKLSAEDSQILLSQTSDELKQDVPQEVKPELKAKTDSSDILVGKNQSSIAQMLASQSLGASSFQSVPNTSIDEFAKLDSNTQKNPEIKKQEKEIKEVKSVLDEEKTIIDNSSSSEKDVSKDLANAESITKVEPVEKVETAVKPEAPEVIEKIEKTEVIKEVSNEVKPEKAQASEKIESITKKVESPEKVEVLEKTETTEIKEIKEIKEVKEDLKTEAQVDRHEEKLDEIKQVEKSEMVEISEPDAECDLSQVNQTSTNVENKEESVQTPVVREIKEKHAKINPKEFDIVPKETPVIDENTEVIEFNHKDYMATKEKELNSKPVEEEKQEVKVVEKDLEVKDVQPEKFAGDVKSLNDVKSEDTNIENKEVVLPEKEIVNDKKVAVPVVLVPNIEVAKKDDVAKDVKNQTSTVEKELNVNNSENTLDKSNEKDANNAEVEKNVDLSLRPYVEIDESNSEIKEVQKSSQKGREKEQKVQELQAKKDDETQAKELAKSEKETEKLAKAEAKKLEKEQKAQELQAKKDAETQAKELAKSEKESDKLAKAEAKKLEKEQKAQELQAKKDVETQAKELAKSEKETEKLVKETPENLQGIDEDEAERIAIQKAKQKAKQRAKAEKLGNEQSEGFNFKKFLSKFRIQKFQEKSSNEVETSKNEISIMNKLFSKVSGDTSEVYEKNDGNKTIIKRLNN